MSVTHELRVAPAIWPRLVDGSKTFELRKDDRCYQPGDILLLRPFDEAKDDDCGDPTCRRNWRGPDRPVLRFRVGFMAKGEFYGLNLGQFALLSLIAEVSP